jgi:hypothetical protein
LTAIAQRRISDHQAAIDADRVWRAARQHFTGDGVVDHLNGNGKGPYRYCLC